MTDRTNSTDRHNYRDALLSFFGADLQFAALGPALIISGHNNCWQWLKRQNGRGECIYVRPSESAEPFFVLLDDLSATQVAAHRNQPGRLITETSPGNYQVWVLFASGLSNNQKRHIIAAAGADTACGPNRRWGRCPGFSNRKRKHIQPSDQYPAGKLFFVRLVAQTDGAAPIPADLPEPTPEPRITGIIPKITGTAPEGACLIAEKYYQAALSNPRQPDLSHADFAIAKILLERGFAPPEVAAVLMQYSPRLSERKPKPDYYVQRTVAAARDSLNIVN